MLRRDIIACFLKKDPFLFLKNLCSASLIEKIYVMCGTMIKFICVIIEILFFI